MKKKFFVYIFLSCVFFVLFSCKENKTNVIQLNLRENNYRELIFIIGIFNNSTFNDATPVSFNGIRKDNCNCWTFCYPDTLYDKSVYFIIHEATQIDTLSRYIGFRYICNKDTLESVALFLANKDTTVINATYLRTDTFPNFYEGYANGNAIYKTRLIDYYLLTSNQDNELLSSIEGAKNDFYKGGDVDSSRYATELGKYNDLVKKYPDSHCLIQRLDWHLYMFNSKSDVQKVFDSFSQENKNSFYGKRLSHYLTDNYFKNSILKTWDTGKSEAIIIDSAKYNLIIFSSAFCRPCIEEIPVLKKIYEDLSDKLEMTYVSIDDSRIVDRWQQLMRKENIPWRSVLAEDNDIDNIIEKYHVPALPHCLFVHPGGFMEKIDVRNTPELNHLYKTVQEEK